MNITQKLYNKIYLNDVLVLIFFIYTAYFGVVTFHKIFFLCISKLVCHVQGVISKAG